VTTHYNPTTRGSEQLLAIGGLDSRWPGNDVDNYVSFLRKQEYTSAGPVERSGKCPR